MGLKDFYKDKVIIVTGASSGIGRAMAIEGAKLGAKIVVAARNEEAMQQVVDEIKANGGEAFWVKVDVSQKDNCKNLVDKTLEKYGKIDILINNAGISMRALFDQMKIEVFEQVMNINFMGTVYCTHAAIKEILKQKGWVVGVSSGAGIAPLPGRTAYSASKFAMYGFLRTLMAENLGRGLKTLVVHPGFTATNVRFRALTADGTPQGETPRKEEKMQTPEYVAKRTFKAIYKGKTLLYLSAEVKLIYLLQRLSPKLSMIAAYKAMKKEPNSPIV